jgi:hypothetical protein
LCGLYKNILKRSQEFRLLVVSIYENHVTPY